MTTDLRAAIGGARLRAAGVPNPLMSDFEIAGAVYRDQQWDDKVSGNDALDMAAYDRRGLLNVLSFLLDAAPPAPLDVLRLRQAVIRTLDTTTQRRLLPFLEAIARAYAEASDG
jgi:hypothetical protein